MVAFSASLSANGCLTKLEAPKIGWLVGGFNPFEKYESQLVWLFPIYGRIKFMFQTTKQMSWLNMITLIWNGGPQSVVPRPWHKMSGNWTFLWIFSGFQLGHPPKLHRPQFESLWQEKMYQPVRDILWYSRHLVCLFLYILLSPAIPSNHPKPTANLSIVAFCVWQLNHPSNGSIPAHHHLPPPLPKSSPEIRPT